MEQISALTIILGEVLNWNKWRLDCLSKAILSMIKVRNVNLQELALGLGGKEQISSRYKRLYRFLRYFKIDLFIISHWLFKLFFSSGQSVYIAIFDGNHCHHIGHSIFPHYYVLKTKSFVLSV